MLRKLLFGTTAFAAILCAQSLEFGGGLVVRRVKLSNLPPALGQVPPHPDDVALDRAARTGQIGEAGAILTAFSGSVGFRLPSVLDRVSLAYAADFPFAVNRGGRGLMRYLSPENAYTFVEERSMKPIHQGRVEVELLRRDPVAISVSAGVTRYPLSVRQGWNRFSRDEQYALTTGAALTASAGVYLASWSNEPRSWTVRCGLLFDWGRGAFPNLGGSTHVSGQAFQLIQFQRTVGIR
jgi:hypothetical protein